MSFDPTNLPYKARTPRRSQTSASGAAATVSGLGRIAPPNRALPLPPPGHEDGEDVGATTAFELAQQFSSPPPPPPPAAAAPRWNKELPPPPTVTTTESEGEDERAPSSMQTTAVESSTTTTAAQSSAAHLHPYHSSLPTSSSEPPTYLTPLRAHYLKKTLVNLQVSHELNLLTDPVLGANALGLLGDPFILPESAKKDALARVSEVSRTEGQITDLPFLRFMFHQFLLPFPFLASAPPTFWSAKVQPFLSSFLATTGVSVHTTLTETEKEVAESLMTKEEKKEMLEKRKLWQKVEKHVALMFGVGIKLTSGEEVVRIGQAELRRLEEAQEERRKKWMLKHRPPPPNTTTGAGEPGSGASGAPTPGPGFEVNVIGVRLVTEKGRVRSRHHEEFIIRTSRSGVSDVFVSRRYGDFKRLADELRLAFPDYPLPAPPPKDKSVTATAPPVVASTGYSAYNPLRVIYGSSSSPTSGTADSPTSSSTTGTGSPLSREKNRLTLRAYLQTVLSLPFVIDSPILRSFLLSAPTTLTPPEAMDCQRRLEADAVREEGRRRFRAEAEKRIEALREGLAQFKGDVLSKEGGLKNVFDVVKRVERVEDLPKAEASVLEWGRISLAATIFQLFVASDTASETLTSVKRLHGLMPYFVLKGILKISNPMAMIRGVLDLFLARPFGGQSLIQRMFSSSLTEDVRLLAEDIETVQEKIDDPVLCQKIEQYANAPFEIQEIFRKDAASEGVDLLVTILRSPDVPTLSRPQFQRVAKATRAYKEYKAAQADQEDSDDDLGPESEDAWLYEDLSILLKLWTRKREKEALLALIFEGVTAELLKDIITIFYTPLAQVYKAASIADSLSDMQAFINDMIRTVEQVEELSQEDPQRTVQTFIDLVQRHEQSFYTFVHNVHSKGHGLFDALMGWIELFLNYARTGLPEPLDLEFILPASEEERRKVMREVDAVAQYHYKLKVAHEEKVRRRFRNAGDGSGSGSGTNVAGASVDEEAALLDSVMASLSIGETAIGDAGDLADEESEEDDQDNEDFDEDDEQVGAGGGGGGRRLLDPDPDPEEEESEQGSSFVDQGSNSNLSVNNDENEEKRSSSNSRRPSNSDGSSGSRLGRIRNSLDFTRKSPSPDIEKKDKEKDKNTSVNTRSKDLNTTSSTPRTPLSAQSQLQSQSQRSSKARRKARKLDEFIKPPETKAIEQLRPIFVEIIRPSMRVRRIA